MSREAPDVVRHADAWTLFFVDQAIRLACESERVPARAKALNRRAERALDRALACQELKIRMLKGGLQA